ncbi:MAG: hypothetical protein K0U98_11725 [Deltaproteobacteria bacterium]|nr:hypothetical protein [Deltaproteobacteria bacterium]
MKPTQNRERFLAAAKAIGASLVRDAIWDGHRCNWLGAAHEEVLGRWLNVNRTLGPDLYGGTSGIALFLNQLYRATGDSSFLLTAMGAIRQAYSRRDDVIDEHRLGLYSGSTGIAWACVEVAATAKNGRWLERGLDLLSECTAEEPVGGHGLDVVSGAAGVIPVLLNCGLRFQREDLLKRASELGDRLLAVARPRAEGWSWNTLGISEDLGQPDLTGFSHGAGGIAWALLELWRETGEERFLVGARQGIRYEQSWFDAEQENWPDFRDSPQAAEKESHRRCASVWCHGAPGIGLARLRAFELLGEEPLRQQAEAALRATYRAALQLPAEQLTFCLCHGLGGNAEIFLHGARILGLQECHVAAEQIGLRGLELFEDLGKPWTSGLPGGVETPNLLLGTAGIGYFYLRLHDPKNVPSILIPCSDLSTETVTQERCLEEAV